jgi:hypothetical protein
MIQLATTKNQEVKSAKELEAKRYFDLAIKYAEANHDDFESIISDDRNLFKSKQGRLNIQSDVPHKVQLILQRGNGDPIIQSLSNLDQLDLPQGDYDLKLGAGAADLVLSSSTISIALCGRTTVHIGIRKKPTSLKD